MVRSDPDEGGLAPATPVSAAHRVLRVLTLNGLTEAAAEAVARLGGDG